MSLKAKSSNSPVVEECVMLDTMVCSFYDSCIPEPTRSSGSALLLDDPVGLPESGSLV